MSGVPARWRQLFEDFCVPVPPVGVKRGFIWSLDFLVHPSLLPFASSITEVTSVNWGPADPISQHGSVSVGSVLVQSGAGPECVRVHVHKG